MLITMLLSIACVLLSIKVYNRGKYIKTQERTISSLTKEKDDVRMELIASNKGHKRLHRKYGIIVNDFNHAKGEIRELTKKINQLTSTNEHLEKRLKDNRSRYRAEKREERGMLI